MEDVQKRLANGYGVAAIAQYLGVREKPCRHCVDRDEILTFKIEFTHCVRRSTLNAWLAERESAVNRPQN